MQNIQTGYVPDGALGALYAGQNAANAQSVNDEELAKLFLANQQSIQMNPLLLQQQQDVNDVGAYNAASARAKTNDPSYIGFDIAGDKAVNQQKVLEYNSKSSLQPFVDSSKKAALEMDKGNTEDMWTLRQVGDSLVRGGNVDPSTNLFVPFTAPQRQFLEQQKSGLIERMGNTPQLWGKLQEIAATADGRLQSTMVQAEARLQAVEAARNKGDALSEKELTISAPSFENQAIKYEAMITKKDIEDQKNAVLTSILSADKKEDTKLKQQALNKIDSDATMYRNLANAARERATQIYKKHGLAVAEAPKVTETPTPTPPAMSSQDEQALAWAKANPNDPRAKAIMAKLNNKIGK